MKFSIFSLSEVKRECGNVCGGEWVGVGLHCWGWVGGIAYFLRHLVR